MVHLSLRSSPIFAAHGASSETRALGFSAETSRGRQGWSLADRCVLTGETAVDIPHQDRTADQEPRVLLHVIEKISRGFHALDSFIHRALDTLDQLVDSGFRPVNRLLHLLEPFH